MIGRNHYHLGFPHPAEKAEAKRLEDERRIAAAKMAYTFANLQMPEDIRSRARSWGLEAFVEVLWNAAFQAGYREAMREMQASPPEGGG